MFIRMCGIFENLFIPAAQNLGSFFAKNEKTWKRKISKVPSMRGDMCPIIPVEIRRRLLFDLSILYE